jgi:hypothetical protein
VRPVVSRRVHEAYGATVSGFAAGYLPLPMAVTTWLLLTAEQDSRSGSVSVLWVLIASVPAALVLGPWNTKRALTAYGDPHASPTARNAVAMGLVGLAVEALAIAPLLYIGWIGLVLDVALPAWIVPVLARQRVLGKLDEEREVARLRRRQRGR